MCQITCWLFSILKDTITHEMSETIFSIACTQSPCDHFMIVFPRSEQSYADFGYFGLQTKHKRDK